MPCTLSDMALLSSAIGMYTDVEIPSVDMVEWSWKPFVWTWTEILHLISAVLGMTGNLLVMLAIYKRRASTRSTDRLIGALALADFLTSVFIIPIPKEDRVPNTPLGQFYCKMVLPGFLLFVSFTSSIYILMAISLERFLAVVYPLFYARLLLRKHLLVIVLALIWTSSIIVYGVFIITVVTVDRTELKCVLHYSSSSAKIVMGVFFLIYRLIFPTAVMLITQLLIVFSLHRRSARYRSKTGLSYHLRVRNRVLKLTFVVILVYIICWGPGQIVFFLYTIDAVSSSFIGGPFHTFVIVLTSYNSCANPIIYTAWFPEFRAALRQTFSCKIKGSRTPIFEENKTEESQTVSCEQSVTNI